MKDNFVREAHYRRQNRGRPLTPKQRRRLQHRRHQKGNEGWMFDLGAYGGAGV